MSFESFAVHLIVITLFIALILSTSFIFKLQPGPRALLVLAYLLCVGLFMYSLTPILSAISLTAGFGLALAFVLLPLKKLR